MRTLLWSTKRDTDTTLRCHTDHIPLLQLRYLLRRSCIPHSSFHFQGHRLITSRWFLLACNIYLPQLSQSSPALSLLTNKVIT